MNKFQKNVANSFSMAKKDILELQKTVSTMNENQKWLIQKVVELQHKKGLELVGSKDSNKVHASNCPFAKNIKTETKQKFNSLDQAASYGYEACDCVIA